MSPLAELQFAKGFYLLIESGRLDSSSDLTVPKSVACSVFLKSTFLNRSSHFPPSGLQNGLQNGILSSTALMPTGRKAVGGSFQGLQSRRISNDLGTRTKRCSRSTTANCTPSRANNLALRPRKANEKGQYGDRKQAELDQKANEPTPEQELQRDQPVD